MKRFKGIVVFLLLIITCLMTLGACDNLEVDSIKVLSGDTEIYVNKFDCDDYTLAISWTNGKTTEIKLEESMLSSEDIAKFSVVGTHQIKINFEGKVAVLDIVIKGNALEDTLTLESKTFGYDGTAKSIYIKEALPEGATVTYVGNDKVDVGVYEVTATVSKANYEDLVIKGTYTITAQAVVKPAIIGEYTYNGLEQTANIVANELYTITGDKQTNAGAYKVKVALKDKENYTWSDGTIVDIELDYVIKKAGLTLTLENKTFGYDGTAKSIYIKEALPEGITVQYVNNSQNLVGDYIVKATVTDTSNNYIFQSELTAVLSIIKDGKFFNVTYKNNDVVLNVDVVSAGTIITTFPQAPEKVGYTSRWNYDNSPIMSDVVLQVVYEVIQYKIEYVLYLAENNPKNPIEYNIESTNITLLSPADMFGRSFVGWYQTSTFEENSRISFIPSGTFGDITVYAKFIDYKIESAEGFEFDYIKHELPALLKTVSYSQNLILLSNVIKVSEGCAWTLSKDIEGTQIINSKNMSLAVGHNKAYITVYYEKDYNLTYILDIYKLDMLTYKFVNEGVTSEITNLEEASFIAQPTPPKKEGYEFLGWSTELNSTKFVSFPYKLQSSTIFYANYKPNLYTLTYNVNGGNPLTNDTQEIEYDASFMLEVPTRKGYTFAGWNLPDGTTLQSGSIWKYASNMMVTAVWKAINYTITYYLDGSTNSASNVATYTVEDNVNFSDSAKIGYTFEGWFTDSTFTNKVTSIAKGSIGNVVLFAKLTVNKYTITYNLDGSTNSVSNVATYTVEDTVNFSDSAKTGYTFEGWFTDSAFANRITSLAKGTIDNITLFAKLTANKYTITYNLNGGAINGSTVQTVQEVTYDSSYTLYTPTRIGYDFVNYTLNGVAIANGVWKTTNNITIDANWQIKYINISYYFGNELLYADSALFDTEYTLRASFTSEGYTLIKWQSEQQEYDPNLKIKIDFDSLILKAKTEYVLTDFEGTISGDNITITGYTGAKNAIIVPDYIIKNAKSYQVTSIGSNAFWTLKRLTSITLPSSVTSIGYSAFNGCTSLTSINIPSSVTSIGDYAFSGCTSLTSITIPSGVTSIGGNAFTDCRSLTSITIPRGVTSIGERAFSGCSSLTSITIPSSVTSIGNGAFANCSSLTSITIPSGVTSIGAETFAGCSSLTSINIPSGVTSIGKNAVFDCTSLIGVYITDIASWCKITFASALSNPLYYAKKLYLNEELVTSITIPSGVTSIGAYAFYNCSSLISITIPSSVTSIGSVAFDDCSSLTIYCEAGGKPSGWDTQWNYSNRPVYYGINSGNYIIANDCEFVLKDGVLILARYIGSSSTLFIPTQVTIGSTNYQVTNIGESAFDGCTSLTSVTIPIGVTSIGSKAFRNCSCLTFYCEAVSKPSGWNTNWNYSDRPVYYGINSGNYITANDCEFVLKDGVLILARYIGSSSTLVIPTQVTLGSTNYQVTNIGNSAFDSCTSLINITIPSSVTSIGRDAFRNCSSLINITIPSSVTSIESGVFYNCSSLTIYCEASGPQSGWNTYWNDSKRPVVWDCKNKK